MSTFSPNSQDVKPDVFSDAPTAGPSRSIVLPTNASTSGPSGVYWTQNGPMLRMESAVVETVVTHTTRTTTSFPPIALPRIPMPDAISRPDHLAPELYPLALEPAPEDMRMFALNLGGKRVVVHEDNTISPEVGPIGPTSGPGWTRSFPSGLDQRVDHAERVNLVQAINRNKGKEVRKRPLDQSRPLSRTEAAVHTPPITAADLMGRPRRSPPRKKIRGLDDLNLASQPSDGVNPLLSPLPSPEQDPGPGQYPAHHVPAVSSPPPIGSGLEMAALFSLPSMVSHFESLPDKLQQQILMHLLRRSRMPTIQRTYAFAGIALKRDFITRLPHEVAVQILRKIDTPTLASAMRVCKKWHRMIDSERGVWRQRLVDDDLWHGMGLEAEEEAMFDRRMDNFELRARHQARLVKAETPSDDDEPMFSHRDARLGHDNSAQQTQQCPSPRYSETASPDPPSPPYHRSVPLKHVYRRRHTSVRNWLETRPEHTAFTGHGTNVVTCLQFDKDKIISASDDHSINVYNISNGQLRCRLDGHEGGVWALEYKGDTLVSGSTDRTVRIWDLEAMQEAHVFHGHTSTVRCLQIVEPVLDEATGEFYPPYPMLITGSRDATLRVWKLPRKGEPRVPPHIDDAGNLMPVPPEHNPWHVHLFEGHTQAVRAISAHGRICVSGSYDNTVRVWDVVSGTCKHALIGHEQKVYSVTYDRFRNRCMSGSMDNTVKVWSVITGECLYTLTGHTALVGLLGVSPNFLVSAAADGSLRVWDAHTIELKHTLASHGGAITCFQHDETKVVSGCDGNLKLWDIRTGEFVRDLVVGISSVWQVAYNGNLLVAASNRNGSTVFDVFDFGASTEPFVLDDESLDRYGRPVWERSNLLEPQEYQVDDIDGVQMTSPRDLMNIASPSLSDRYARDGLSSRMSASGSGTRRSSRLAARTPGWSYSADPPPRSKRGSSSRFAQFTSHPGAAAAMANFEAYSPSPAGPSRQPAAVLGANDFMAESFAPIFDEEEEEEEEEPDANVVEAHAGAREGEVEDDDWMDEDDTERDGQW